MAQLPEKDGSRVPSDFIAYSVNRRARMEAAFEQMDPNDPDKRFIDVGCGFVGEVYGKMSKWMAPVCVGMMWHFPVSEQDREMVESLEKFQAKVRPARARKSSENPEGVLRLSLQVKEVKAVRDFVRGKLTPSDLESLGGEVDSMIGQFPNAPKDIPIIQKIGERIPRLRKRVGK